MSGIGDLVANLVADTKQWVSGLNTAKAQASSFAADVTSILGGIAVGAGAKLSIEAAESDITATKKLESILRATGDTAGVTADEISNLAAELQKTTKFEDDATVGAAAILATFKEISGVNFTETLRLGQDLAALKDMDLTSAVEMLGKALNDPADGFAKLTRAGIMFSDEQKQIVIGMAEAGDAAGAQATLLKMLRETIGGVAADTVTETQKMSLAWGEINEQIGKILLPAVAALAAIAVPFMQEWGGVIAHTAVAVGVLVTALLAIVTAQKAIAVAQTIVLALAGPAGWMNLAAAAAVAAVAIGGIEVAFAGVADEAERAANAAANAGQAANAAGDEFGGANFGGGEFGPGDKVINGAKEIGDKIAEDILILSGAFTRAELEIEKLRKEGLSDEEADVLREAAKQRDALTQQNAERKRREDEANRIRESVMTPQERFDAEQKKIEGLRRENLLTQEEADRAIERAQKALEDATNPEGDKTDVTKDAGKIGALEKGSVEAASAVLQAMRSGQGGIEEKQLQAEEEQVEVAQRQLDEIKRLGDQGLVLYGGSFA